MPLLSFLVPFVGFLLILKLERFFDSLLTQTQKGVKYSTTDKALTEIIAIASGCTYTLHINSKLAKAPIIARQIELQRFPEQSTMNRFLNSFTLILLIRSYYINDKDKVKKNEEAMVGIF